MKKILLNLFVLGISVSAYSQTYTVAAPTVGSSVGFNDMAGYATVFAAPQATDVMSAAQTIPFAFTFYGNSYTQYKVSDNGYITFDLTATVSDPANGSIPSVGGPNNAIYAFWDSLGIVTGTGSADAVYSYTYGATGSRTHVIQWYSLTPTVGTTVTYMYAAIELQECGGGFNIILPGASAAGLSGTIGCENAAGSVGTMVGASPNFVIQTNAPQDGTDDVVYAFTSSANTFDVAGGDINIAAIVTTGNNTITGTVYNTGSATVTSIAMSYSIDGGAAVNQTFSGLSVASGASYTYSFTTPWVATAGAHTVGVTSGLVNGVADVASCNNVSPTKNVLVYDPANKVPITPLFEVFTSSTCPPCNPGNANYLSVVGSKPFSNYVSIKFQQDFPGTGDPYATTETVNRRGNYYAINSIPRMECNGGWDQNAQSFTDALYTQFRNDPAFATMDGTYSVDTVAKVVSYTLHYTPAINFAANKVRLYLGITEKETVKNVKTNGETIFYSVMKKMLPDETGTLLSALTAGTAQTVTSSYTFNGSYFLPADGQAANHINHATQHCVEHFSRLNVAGWLQLSAEKNVLQAVNLTNLSTGIHDATATINTSSILVFPSPASANVNVQFDLINDSEVDVQIVNICGQVVDHEKGMYTGGRHNLNVETSTFANGTYFISFGTTNGKVSKSFVVQH